MLHSNNKDYILLISDNNMQLIKNINGTTTLKIAHKYLIL